MTAPRTLRLEVVRDAEHARTGAGVLRMTHAELFERLAVWGALDGAATRDDDAPLFLCASVLAARSPFSARLAPALADLWRELGEARVSALELARALAEDGSAPLNAGARAAEVARLVADLLEVERRMVVAGLVDRPRAAARALLRLSSGETPGFLRAIASVDVLGLIEASDIEIDLLIAIARTGMPVRAVLPVDARGRGLTGGTEPVLKRFEAAHDVDALELSFVEIGAEPCDEATPAAAASALFSDERAPHAPAWALACADRSDEARTVAALIARVRTDDPDARVALALRSLDGEERRFADALAAHGIAVRLARRPLADTAAGRLVRDLLALATDGAPRDRLMAVLTSPAQRAPHALSLEDGARVLRVLRRAAARTDVEDLATPRGGYAHRLARFRQGLGPRDAALAADADLALAAVTRTLTHIAPLRDAQPLARALGALRALVDDVMEDGAGLFGAEVKDALARLHDAAVRTADQTPVAPRVTALLVVRALRHHGAPDRVDDDRAVSIVSVPQLWGRAFDHVVVVGAEEGRFPLPAREAGLLADADRARINARLGRRALRTAEHDPLAAEGAGTLALEPLWLVGALLAARASFTITTARRDDRGRELSPSSFFLDVERALGARAAPRRAASPREHRAHIARARARGELTDALASTQGVDARLVADADRWARMARERGRFFLKRRADGVLAASAPYAFSVSPARIERAFGASFGITPSRPLTPTRLEALAECRMHGFVQHVLKVDVDEPAGNAADARVLGTLAHAVLETFFLERKRARVPLARFSKEDRLRLRAIFDDETRPLLAGRATGHLAAIRAQLGWLETALVRAVSMLLREPKVRDVEPVDLELCIGVSQPNGDAPEYASVPIHIADAGAERTLYIGGIIDRVDEGTGGRVVLDYKTASTSSIRRKAARDALFDKHFQLLLYLRLMEHHRPSHARVPLHGYLVSLREGTTSDDVGEVPELRARVLEDAREDSLAAAVGRVVMPILQGVLPPDAGDRCDECRLQRLCRVPLIAELAPDLDDNEEGGAA